jgi:hypothetical protein
MIRVASAFNLFKISLGNPAGPNNPNHCCDSKPGIPASIMVGRAGITFERLSDVTASARSWFARTCGSFRGDFSADRAARSRAVLDHYRLLPRFKEFLRERACERVRYAACGLRGNDADRLARIALSNRASHRQRQDARGKESALHYSVGREIARS